MELINDLIRWYPILFNIVDGEIVGPSTVGLTTALALGLFIAFMVSGGIANEDFGQTFLVSATISAVFWVWFYSINTSLAVVVITVILTASFIAYQLGRLARSEE